MGVIVGVGVGVGVSQGASLIAEHWSQFIYVVAGTDIPLTAVLIP